MLKKDIELNDDCLDFPRSMRLIKNRGYMKKNLLRFGENQLLKGLTAKKAHADELAEIHYREFKNYG